MKIVSADTMRSIDKCAIEEFGIAGIVLMEHAALGIMEELTDYAGQRILIVCGKGNNGGDGFALARLLRHRGYDVKIACGEVKSADAVTNYHAARKCGVRMVGLDEDFAPYDVLVDALLGTGFSGQLSEEYREIIERMNRSGKTIVSVDIPSGMDAMRGDIHHQCVHAHKTVTLALPKPGLYCSPEQTGELVVKDIAIPDVVTKHFLTQCETIEETAVQGWLPQRRTDGHKGDFGKGFIIATSGGMTGAGILAAKAASGSGIGLVCEAVPETLNQSVESVLIEEMTLPIPDLGLGRLVYDAYDIIRQKLPWADAVLFGCGLGRHVDIGKILEELIWQCEGPLIIDADGLYALAQKPDLLHHAKNPVIVTPHAGEMARLLGKSVEEVESNRFETVRKFSEKYGCVTVLKGAKTLVSDGKQVYVNTTGNNGMATGGSGDVLSGVILAFAANGMPPLEAAAAAVYVHGAAGDSVCRQMGVHGVTAGKIAEQIPLEIKKIFEKKRDFSQQYPNL